MGLFKKRDEPQQQPCEAFSRVEEGRADRMAEQIVEIQGRPDSTRKGSLPFYQDAYRRASHAAATNTAQPSKPKRGWKW